MIRNAVFLAAFVGAGCSRGAARWDRVGEPPREPAWISFRWADDEVDGRRIERIALMVPARLDDDARPVEMQLDLGSDATMIQASALRRIGRAADSPAQDVRVALGDDVFRAPRVLVRDDGGDDADEEGGPPNGGTLGVDVFRDRVLVLDYPRRRLRVLDEPPAEFRDAARPIEINAHGKVVFPMTLRGLACRVLFDTGSSRFQLMTTAERIDEFSTAAPVDSIPVWSFGKPHVVVGRPIADEVVLAGEARRGVVVYADARAEAVDLYRADGVDALTGNALFWDRTVVVDFRNRTFAAR